MKIECKENHCCILDNLLYLGNIKTAQNESELSKLNIKAIICLLPKKYQIPHDESKFSVLNINTEDKTTCSLSEWAPKTSDFIEEHISKKEAVYVHCAQGISRSTSCVLYYLMTKKNMNLKNSFDLLRSKRNVICPTTGFFSDLVNLDIKLFGKSSFSLEEYSLMCMEENFPTIPKEEIEKIYKKYKDIYIDENKKYSQKYLDEAKNKNIEPIGYYCMDELINGIGKDKFIKRVGCSLHHPFD